MIDARRERDENPLSKVVAETMKLLGNSSYGYHFMDRSRHTITKYLNDEKTHRAINEPLFKRLNTVEKVLFEVELLKSTIEHSEPIVVGFFILQYAKLRMLDLYYNCFDKFCDVGKFEMLEMDTESLYLALVEENLYDCIQPDKRAAWEKRRENDCRDSFKADAKSNFSLERVAIRIKSIISGKQDFSKKILDVQKCYVCVARHIAAMTTSQTSSNSAVKV